jgi:histidinol-phosphate/aromatic aminotransferase/cobyric acid decarboxylase-like protein
MNSIKEKIKKLKELSGSHSSSISTLINGIPQLKIKIDACFLSNPYATDLFMKHLENDLIKKKRLRDVLEFYPPQNREISATISKRLRINTDNIFVGNGAIEVIQAVLHRFVKGKLCVILPTFSSYYEFSNDKTEVVYYRLSKQNNFEFDLQDYIRYVKDNNINNIVLINPNNPNGGYIQRNQFHILIQELQELDNIIIDESFIHFAYEDINMFQVSNGELIQNYPNLVIIKSMSKDFGIAGIRAGYGIMAADKISKLLRTGYLWNISGLANYFFKLYESENFQQQYEIVRKKYIMNTLLFMTELSSINNIKVYSSKANFVLLEVPEGCNSFDFTMDLLIENGVYVRDCSDKIGLEGEFIRIASRTFEENLEIINTIRIISAM